MGLVQNEHGKIAASLALYPWKRRSRITPRLVSTMLRELHMPRALSSRLRSLKLPKFAGEAGASPAGAAPAGGGGLTGASSSPGGTGGAGLSPMPSVSSTSMQRQQLGSSQKPGQFKNFATPKMMKVPGVGAKNLGVPPATPWAPPKLGSLKLGQMAMPMTPLPTGPNLEAIQPTIPTEPEAPPPPPEPSTMDKLKETGTNALSGAMMGAMSGGPLALPLAVAGGVAGALYNPVLKPAGKAVGNYLAYGGPLNPIPGWMGVQSPGLRPGEVYADQPQTAQETEKAIRSGDANDETYGNYMRYKGQWAGAGQSVPNGKLMPSPGDPGYDAMVADIESTGKISPDAKYLLDDPNYKAAAFLEERTAFPRAGSARDILYKIKMADAEQASLSDSMIIHGLLKHASGMEKQGQWWRTLGRGIAAMRAPAAAARPIMSRLAPEWQQALGPSANLNQGLLSRAGRWLGGGRASAPTRLGQTFSWRAPFRIAGAGLGAAALGGGAILHGITPTEQQMPGTPWLSRALTGAGLAYGGSQIADKMGVNPWLGAAAGGILGPQLLSGLTQGGGGGLGGLMQNPLVAGLGSYALARKFAPGGIAGIPPWALGLMGGVAGPQLLSGLGGGGQQGYGQQPNYSPIYQGQAGY